MTPRERVGRAVRRETPDRVPKEAGFTPAALAYLSGIAEEHGTARGAIMGVYSVLLGIGQAVGSITGGEAAGRWGVDGMITLMLVFAIVACFAVTALIRMDRALRCRGS